MPYDFYLKICLIHCILKELLPLVPWCWSDIVILFVKDCIAISSADNYPVIPSTTNRIPIPSTDNYIVNLSTKHCTVISSTDCSATQSIVKESQCTTYSKLTRFRPKSMPWAVLGGPEFHSLGAPGFHSLCEAAWGSEFHF